MPSAAGSFIEILPPLRFFPAVEVFSLQPLFAGGPRWFTGAAVFGQAACGGNERLKAGICPFQIGPLGTFLIGVYDNFILTGDSVCQQFPRPVQLGSGNAVNISETHPQRYLGVDLVDILATGAAGAGKGYFSGGSDRLPQKDGVHWVPVS
jgi:hypothetical protein